MSAPPLPEVFGNYALKDFIEIADPAAISWLPQTAGWLYLGIALLIWLAYRLFRQLQHWHRNRYRREAQAELAQLRQQLTAPQLVSELNALLKRTALAVYPRAEVAALAADSWLEFLNGECDSPVFEGSNAQLLLTGSYQPRALASQDASELIDHCLSWVQQHRGVLA
jgi:hypothetical protein